jgi:hypothetical protein
MKRTLKRTATVPVKVIVPMAKEHQTEGHIGVLDQDGAKKRRYSRHRYLSEIHICREAGVAYDAMTFEISEGGLSAATSQILPIGEAVLLYPVLGYRLAAIIKSKEGAMYGFEFVGLSDQQRETIRAKCQSLPLFVSLNDE